MKTKLILCLFLILLLMFILKIQKETFQDTKEKVQNKLKSKSYPFDYDKKCDSIYGKDKYTMHINNELFEKNIPKIHLVDPNSPCCLRTCINDFTYTPENTPKNSRYSSEYGNLLPFVSSNPDNLDTLYVSQCDQCIKNFSKAIELLNTGNKCLETE